MNDQLTTATATSTQGAQPPEKAPLDDVMLAMDVVDTLRRRERLVKREMDEEGREENLKQRLRKIYAQQGIEVPDHVLEQGVAALREDRFTYKPSRKGVSTQLAHIYVNRARWGKWVGAGMAVAVVVLAVNYFAFILPKAAIPEDLASSHSAVIALAKSDNARSMAERMLDAGNIAVREGKREEAKTAISQLEDLRLQLEQEYTVRIVNRQNERSGVWRVPDVNTNARNYYIIVEAIDHAGKPLTVPIENEETGKISMVDIWGQRVDESVFNAVARDKQDNGIIDRDRFGYKKPGYLVPDYEIPTSGGAITRW